MVSRPTGRIPLAWRTTALGFVLCAALALQGCASPSQQVAAPDIPALASFYWPYAALATDVYRTGGKVSDELVLAGASPWLRREWNQASRRTRVAPDEGPGSQAADLMGVYRQFAARRCVPSPGEPAAGASNADLGNECKATLDGDAEVPEADEDLLVESNRSIDRTPTQEADCDDRGGRKPLVPVAMAMRQRQWERAPEFHRHAQPGGWRIFVPHLAVDVWRRPLPSQNASPAVEYAIVYRGTVGGGGWLSNLRALTAITPLIWDQYRQAELTTRMIIRQIQSIHRLSDALFQREIGTQLHITAVGHSLGAGLAHHIFLRVSDITRVVGFDPSPIDGASLIPLDQRSAVMGARKLPIHLREDDPSGATIHFLFERGEILSRIAPCHDGPIWGSEGGPVVRCESVDFSRGNVFRQHNMARLACLLFLKVGPADGMNAGSPSHEARMAER